MKKQKQQLILTLAGCLVMLAALLMPLVSVLSYGWNLSEVLRKMPSLIPAWQQAVGGVLLLLMVVMPLFVAFRSLAGRSVQRWAVALPVISALMLVITMTTSHKPVAPAYGLWIYLVAAFALMAIYLKRN